MSDFFTPLTPDYTLLIPEDTLTLVGWFIWFGMLIFMLIRYRDQGFKLNRRTLIWLALLSSLVLVFTPFLGVRFKFGLNMSPGALPLQHMMFLAAVPWLVGSGVLGTLPAAMLAGISGVLLAYLDTHNIFTPLIFMTLSLFFSACVRQRYRTRLFRLLRFPVSAGIVSLVLALPFIFIAQILSLDGTFIERMAVSFRAIPGMLLAGGGMMLIGSLVCVLVWAVAKESWGSKAPLKPAPGEVSIKHRLIGTALPIFIVFLIILGAVSWRIAENHARQVLMAQLTSTSRSVAAGLTSFREVGESLILNLADDDRLRSGSPQAIESLLNREMETSSYFQQLVLLDSKGERLVSAPASAVEKLKVKPNETFAIEQVLGGASLQVTYGYSESEENGWVIGFFAGITDSNGDTTDVLWGQTNLSSNTFFQPLINTLMEFEHNGGIGQIVAGDGGILYQTDPQAEIQSYRGSTYATATYFETELTNGSRLMHYYQPVSGLDWAVVTSLPERALQALAWQTALPLLLIGTSALCLILAITLVGLTPMIQDIHQIKSAAERLTKGDYEVDLSESRVKGEMGQLNKAFQDMVTALSGRIRKQTDLISLSEKMTDQLNLQDSLQVVMESALERGVSSVRIILENELHEKIPDGSASRFGIGKHARLFVPLDGEILTRTRSQGPIVLRDFQIGKVLHLQKGMPYPASMIAMPLEWQDMFLGVMWVTFQDRRSPSAEEVDFFKALSQKVSTAVINAKTLGQSLTVLNQFESVLESLPDAVVISDAEGGVIYQNQMAQTMFGEHVGLMEGKARLPLFSDEDLSELYEQGDQKVVSKEVHFVDGNTYHVIVSPIEMGGGEKGHATIFKDITPYKVQESLKTEFVTTVSHELRSPLTLIHGYAKILRLTGNLNEQQDSYIGNIIEGIEEMKDLVQNLLDIGRLEGGDSLEITPVTVSKIAKKAVDSMDAQAKQKNIHMKLSLPDDSFVIEADVTFLVQALKNYLENAIKYSKMGGEVSLTVRHKDQDVIFAVRDNGIGIAPLDQRHLFKKFKRINAGVGVEQKGSGLGLAIVKSIAERHGGKVWAESQLGKGSTFYLQIPRKLQD